VRMKKKAGKFLKRNTKAESTLLISELALYQQVINGRDLFRSGRAERIYRELNRKAPWDEA